jgi:uncharacterized protein (TIGR02588 family)
MKDTTGISKVTEKGEAHWIEWATAIVSTLIVAGVIGWVGWRAVTQEEVSPAFRIAITERGPVEGGYRVLFDVSNSSERTAAGVVVRGEVMDGDVAVEQADVSFDYVPAQSKASGAMLFAREPRGDQIRLRTIGYTDP